MIFHPRAWRGEERRGTRAGVPAQVDRLSFPKLLIFQCPYIQAQSLNGDTSNLNGRCSGQAVVSGLTGLGAKCHKRQISFPALPKTSARQQRHEHSPLGNTGVHEEGTFWAPFKGRRCWGAGLSIRKGVPWRGQVPWKCRQVRPILEILAAGEPEVDV